MEIILDGWSLFWIIMLAVMVGLLFGSGIGYYAALKDEERKQQKILDSVGYTPYFAKEKESFALGYIAGSVVPIPGVGAYEDNVDPLGQAGNPQVVYGEN